MTTMDELPKLTKLLRQLSTEAAAGHISVDVKNTIKSQLGSAPPSSTFALQAPPLRRTVSSEQRLEDKEHTLDDTLPLVSLLKAVSECFRAGLISAEQKFGIKSLLLNGQTA